MPEEERTKDYRGGVKAPLEKRLDRFVVRAQPKEPVALPGIDVGKLRRWVSVSALQS
jgi:hypothetical protein